MKSVQGDSGHAQVKMVADVYSYIIDDDRRLNAQRQSRNGSTIEIVGKKFITKRAVKKIALFLLQNYMVKNLPHGIIELSRKGV